MEGRGKNVGRKQALGKRIGTRQNGAVGGREGADSGTDLIRATGICAARNVKKDGLKRRKKEKKKNAVL